MTAEGNVGIAFALVIGAGLATTVGAALVFFVNIAKPRLLAGALGFSAGVMIYVSFAELFSVKTMDAFEEYGLQDNEAQRYATFCFFGGVIIVYVLSGLVHLVTMLMVYLNAEENRQKLKGVVGCMGKETVEDELKTVSVPADAIDVESQPTDAYIPDEVAPQGDVKVLDPGSSMAATSFDRNAVELTTTGSSPTLSISPSRVELIGNGPQGQPVEHSDGRTTVAQPTGYQVPPPTDPDVALILSDDHHSFALKRMGLLTALALFLHNFPEGMATFVAGLSDVSLGGSIAVAIAIHNIPEGVSVALPIYYATGSRWKGFFWAVVSGLSEPLGGLVAWAALSNTSPLAYAIVFGIVAGMMVCISVKELLPTALRFDPEHRWTLIMFFFGMVFMAASLLLFNM